MPRVTLRIDLFTLYSDDDPRLQVASILRNDVTFAIVPRSGDNVRGLAAGHSIGLSEHYRVSYMEHWPELAAPPGSDDEGTCWVVCQGPWPEPGTTEDYAFDALLRYQEDGWELHLWGEVEERFREFQAKGGLPQDLRPASLFDRETPDQKARS